MRWNMGIVLLSLVIAVVVATAGVFILLSIDGMLGNIIAAVVIGIAVCSMHYTGMYGVEFLATDDIGTNKPYRINYYITANEILVSIVAGFIRYTLTELGRFRIRDNEEIYQKSSSFSANGSTI